METGPPFYVVIQATRRSSRLQGKGSTFISQLFLRPWLLVRPRESNPRPPALQSSALSTELILPRLNNNGSLFLDCLVVKKTGVKIPFCALLNLNFINGLVIFSSLLYICLSIGQVRLSLCSLTVSRHVYNYCTSVHQQSQSRVPKQKKAPNQGGKYYWHKFAQNFPQ